MIPTPPKLNELPAGTQLCAGLESSTILADFDFETYSPAGFVWSQELNKFVPPKGTKIKGLSLVGAASYTEHADAEVLSMAYDLKDGKGKRLWIPGDPNPLDLFKHIADGKLLEAWNCSFENWVWVHICQSKYNWPPLPMRQLRDAAAKSRAFALPGSLANAGAVLNITNKKDKNGKRLLDLFSIPRNPTKANPSKRIYPKDVPEEAKALYEYNLRDIEAEAELSSRIPDLSESELEFWLCDQAINFRGVQIDRGMVEKAISIIEQAQIKYNPRINILTGGAVKAASEIQKIREWLTTQGIYTDSLDAESLEKLLSRTDLTPVVKEVLEIRELLGSAAVKKLYAMANQITRRGRVHDLFIYHSARTGRAAGTGPQPQNLPNSGPMVFKCSNSICNRYFGMGLLVCPWCAIPYIPIKEEWNAEAVEDALEIIATKSLSCVEFFWGNPLEVVSGCLRGMFIAAPNHDLICSDYSAIEAVVLAAIAGEEWRLEVFRTHGKIYEMSAAKITGLPFDDFLKHKQETGQHHPLRKKVGKVAELACFTHDTQVLTDRGYLSIMDVTLFDKLWDGKEWVKHSGIIRKGRKKVLKLDGVEMTPSHPINLGHSWKEAYLLVLNENMLIQALTIGSENLPILENLGDQKKAIDWQNVNVHAVNLLTRLILILEPEDQDDAIDALKKLLTPKILSGLKHTKATDILYQILNIDADWEIVYQQLLVVVTTLKTLPIQITEAAALKFAMLGAEKSMIFLRTLLQFPDGITKCLKWIEWIVMAIMNQETSDLFLDQIINLINEKFKNYKIKSNNLKIVYDIVNAGPRNRFTIKTNSGHLIVHNSGYQGWIGAWKNFGADEFFNDDEIKQAILAWRKASPTIVEMWGGQQRYWKSNLYGLEGAAVSAILNPGTETNYRGISYLVKGDVLYCRLLSGRYLTYHKPRLERSERREGTYSISYEGWNTNPKNGGIGWIKMYTYGGKLTENIVQATARDILAYAIINLEKAGYPVVLHVHDEIVAEVPENFGSVKEFEKIMATLPNWCKDWPLKASDGWRGKRYRK